MCLLPHNKLPDTEVVWSQNLQHDLIRLLHLFCAVSRSAVECCRGVRWSKFGIRSTRVFFAASCSECRGRCKDPAEIPPPPESTLLIGFEATPPSTWSWEFLFSLDLSLDISRYLSDWFLQICLTFPSVFVRSGRRGWSVKVWGWHWANRTVVTISELWLAGQGRAGLGQMLDRGHHRVLALSCPPLKVDKQAITTGNLGNRIFLMGF